MYYCLTDTALYHPPARSSGESLCAGVDGLFTGECSACISRDIHAIEVHVRARGHRPRYDMWLLAK